MMWLPAQSPDLEKARRWAPDPAGAVHGLSRIWKTEREGLEEAEGWQGGEVGAKMLPALGLCVG